MFGKFKNILTSKNISLIYILNMVFRNERGKKSVKILKEIRDAKYRKT